MEKTDKEIILYMIQDQDWHIPSEILKGTCLEGRNHEKPMSLPNIIKRCNFLVKEGFLKTPDPVKDRALHRMKEKGIFCIRDGFDTFKRLVTEFIGTPDTEEFFYSNYCQNCINSELVEKIIKEGDYPKNIKIEKGYRIPSRFNLIGKNRPDLILEYGKGTVLTDEQALDLLRESPSALRALISTGEKFETSRFDKILILNLLLDVEKYDRKEGTKIRLDTEIKIKLQLIKKDEYLFNWDTISENDSSRLIDFLKQNYEIDWVQAAKIDLIDNGKTIMVTNNKNFLSLSLNDETFDVSLQIDDGRTDKYIANYENGKINIYKDGKKDILGKIVDIVQIQPANKTKYKELTPEELLNKMIELRENDTENFTINTAGYY